MFNLGRAREKLLTPSGSYRDLPPRCLADRRDALNELLHSKLWIELRVAIYAYANDCWLLSATSGISEAGEPVRLSYDASNNDLGNEILDLLLRCYAHPVASSDGSLEHWAVFRASGAKSGRSFERASTYVSIRTMNSGIVINANRRQPPSELYVGQTLSITPDPEELGRAVKKVVDTVRLLDSQGAL